MKLVWPREATSRRAVMGTIAAERTESEKKSDREEDMWDRETSECVTMRDGVYERRWNGSVGRRRKTRDAVEMCADR